MSHSANIIQIMPAAGWVAVYEYDGEESAESLVCFALVEEGAAQRRVRPMCADGGGIVFADAIAGYVRVEELADFEDEEDEGDEEGEEDEEE